MVFAKTKRMKFNANNLLPRWACILAIIALSLLGFTPLVHATRTVTLTWDSDTDTQIVGYRLYYGTASASYGQFVDVGNLTTTTLANLASGTTYFVVVTSYNAVGLESLPSNEVSFDLAADPTPVVSLFNPGSTIDGPATIILNASASVQGATIVKVEFYAGSNKLGEATSAPYSLVWNNAQPGSYNLVAIAYDSNGASASSGIVPVNIVSFGVTKLEQTSDGIYHLTATGAPGSTYNVYISEDLAAWRLLKTVTNNSGTVNISDETASGVPRRFYKLAVNSAGVSSLRTNARAQR